MPDGRGCVCMSFKLNGGGIEIGGKDREKRFFPLL